VLFGSIKMGNPSFRMEKQQVGSVSDPGTPSQAETPGTPEAGQSCPPASALGTSRDRLSLAASWLRCRRDGLALIAYLLDSEVHTFAFSVAANAIISFIPFVVLLYALARSVFHSQENDMMVKVINQMVVYFIPSPASENWLFRNFWHASGHGAEFVSLIMILVACTGIFLPLEVALNKAWGVTKSRNYLHNQTVALGLALMMVVLGMTSILLNAAFQAGLAVVFFHHTQNLVFRGISFLFLAATTGVACMTFFFFIYLLIPNRKIPWRPVMRTAIYTGVFWMVARVVFAAVLPHIDLEIYGPFYISVGLLFWAYISGLILFAGAQFSVAQINHPKNKAVP
jgi:membrane protein